MRELLIATRNEGKMPEIRHALEGVPFTIIDINDVPTLAGFEPEETGATFEENAVLKAKEYGTRAGMLTLADDSGLEVDALNGEPGVKSARYASGSDEDRYLFLLEKMKDVPDEKRTARFRCTIAIYDPAGGLTRICEGKVSGHIARQQKQSGGFGYDPVFFNDETGRMHSDESIETRTRVSHRGKALKKAREILLTEFT